MTWGNQKLEEEEKPIEHGWGNTDSFNANRGSRGRGGRGGNDVRPRKNFDLDNDSKEDGEIRGSNQFRSDQMSSRGRGLGNFNRNRSRSRDNNERQFGMGENGERRRFGRGSK